MDRLTDRRAMLAGAASLTVASLAAPASATIRSTQAARDATRQVLDMVRARARPTLNLVSGPSARAMRTGGLGRMAGASPPSRGMWPLPFLAELNLAAIRE